jgi:hypothetical protein
MNQWKVAYTVRLEKGKITYLNKCYECGWDDSDNGFFTIVNGRPYCSLHKSGGNNARL